MGENCKTREKRKRKGNTVTGSWVASSGADAALGSRRDVGRRRFVSEGRSNEAPGSKGYVYHPVDVTFLLFGAPFSPYFLYCFYRLYCIPPCTRVRPFRGSLYERTWNLVLKVSLRVTFNLLSRSTSNRSLSRVDLLSFRSIIIFPLMKIFNNLF